MKGTRAKSDQEAHEALLSQAEEDVFYQLDRSTKSPTIFLLAITACVALVLGVFLERYLLLDKNVVCTVHVSQSSECTSSEHLELEDTDMAA